MDIGKLYNLERTVVLELQSGDLRKDLFTSSVDDLSIPIWDFFLWVMVKRSQIPAIRDWVVSKFNRKIVQYVLVLAKSTSSVVDIDVAVLESNSCINGLSQCTIVFIIGLWASQTEVESRDRALSWDRLVKEIKVSFERSSHDGAVGACPRIVHRASRQGTCFGGDVCDWGTVALLSIVQVYPLTACRRNTK